MNKKIRDRIGISPELIFIVLVVAVLLGAYYMGKAKNGAIASHKGTSVDWLAGGDTDEAGGSGGAGMAVKHRPRHSINKILALMDQIGGTGSSSGDLSLSDVVDDTSGSLDSETKGGSLDGKEYALLGGSSTDGSSGDQSGAAGHADGASSDKPTSEAGPSALASMSSPSLWGYGGGGGSSFTIAVDCSLCCCECGDPCCEKEPDTANTEPASSESSSPGALASMGSGGGVIESPFAPDEPGDSDPPSAPGKPPVTSPVPEPAMMLLLGLGLAGIGAANACRCKCAIRRQAGRRPFD